MTILMEVSEKSFQAWERHQADWRTRGRMRSEKDLEGR